MELLFAMKKSMEIYRKLWYCIENYRTLIYYGKSYGTIPKTIVLHPKLCYYTENYDTLI